MPPTEEAVARRVSVLLAPLLRPVFPPLEAFVVEDESEGPLDEFVDEVEVVVDVVEVVDWYESCERSGSRVVVVVVPDWLLLLACSGGLAAASSGSACVDEEADGGCECECGCGCEEEEKVALPE